MIADLFRMIAKAREMRRNETLTRAELQNLQLTKFRKLVRHANTHSPYYAQIIRERSIDLDRCVPGDFPVLTKSLLMANFDAIVTDRRVTRQGIADFLTRSQDPSDMFLDEFRVMHTSGTSGEMGYFVYSPRDWVHGALRGRRNRSIGRRRRSGRFRAAFFGATGGHYAGVTMTSAANRGLGRFFVDFRAYEVNSPLAPIIEQMNAFQPELLLGYTTALKVLAQKQREGVLRLTPLGISATGEMVSQADMTVLKEAFGADVVSVYACTEHLTMGVSAPNATDITLMDDDLIFEFHDDHSIVTNLFNETMPLIRYRMSDILRPVPLRDPTSRWTVIHGLVGRAELTPTFLNRDGVEDFISPITIAEIFVSGVLRFQMHLASSTSFRFLAILDPALDAAQRARAIAGLQARLREILEQKRMDNVTFEVAPVDEIPIDPRTRKFKLIRRDEVTR